MICSVCSEEFDADEICKHCRRCEGCCDCEEFEEYEGCCPDEESDMERDRR